MDGKYFRRCRKHFLIGFLLISFCCQIMQISSASETGYSMTSELFRLEEWGSRFYVAYLNVSGSWNVSCTARYDGIFYLYLFESSNRPLTNYIDSKGNLNSDIYSDCVAYNESYIEIYNDVVERDVSYITLNFTSTVQTLYYLEVILVEGGPDSFEIVSQGTSFSTYHIPFIPGFPVFPIFSAMIITSGIIIGRISKKKQKGNIG